MDATVGMLTPTQELRRKTRDTLISLGLNEIVTYTLVSENDVENGFKPIPNPIALAMPMSEARKYIRNNLMPSVLECLEYNNAHKNLNNAYFEISKIYGEGVEEERLALVLDGNFHDDYLHKQVSTADFYVMKGILTEWLERLGFQDNRIHIEENKTDVEHFHPYKSADLYLDKTYLGTFGEIHPRVAKQYDLKTAIYAELSLDALLECKASRVKFVPLERYPAVTRDIAIVVDRDTSAKTLLDCARHAKAKTLKEADVFDVYEGEHVEKGKKSVALHFVYQASDHTLTEAEIAEDHEKILNALAEKTGAQLRN